MSSHAELVPTVQYIVTQSPVLFSTCGTFILFIRVPDIFVRIRIRGSVTSDEQYPAPDPALFVSDLQDANYIFAFYFWKVHSHYSYR
jgi:hypothetical protein